MTQLREQGRSTSGVYRIGYSGWTFLSTDGPVGPRTPYTHHPPCPFPEGGVRRGQGRRVTPRVLSTRTGVQRSVPPTAPTPRDDEDPGDVESGGKEGRPLTHKGPGPLPDEEGHAPDPLSPPLTPESSLLTKGRGSLVDKWDETGRGRGPRGTPTGSGSPSLGLRVWTVDVGTNDRLETGGVETTSRRDSTHTRPNRKRFYKVVWTGRPGRDPTGKGVEQVPVRSFGWRATSGNDLCRRRSTDLRV